MGFLYKLGRIRSYILIVLFFVALIVSAPIKRKVTSTIDAQMSVFTDSLHKNTGLSISYKSMSPSILSNFVIKDITIFDEQKDVVLKINKSKVSFSLKNIMKKDFYNIISGITIDGVEIDVDKIIELVNRFQNISKKSDLAIEDIQRMIPSNTRLKNILLSFENDDFSASANIKTINLNNDLKKQFANVQFDSNAKLNIKALRKNLGCKINLSGTLTHQLDNSQVTVKLLDLTDGDYHLSKLNLHIGYDKNKIQIHTIQSTNPISMAMDYNVKTEDFNAQLKTDKLYPLAVLTTNTKNKDFRKFKKISLDTDTIVKCNLKEKKINYITDSSLFIPDEIFPGSITVDLSLFGNEQNCDLTHLSLNGENIDASAQLEFVYKTSQLSGLAELRNFILPNGKVIATEVYFDPLEEGFMAFSPQIFLGDKAFTALQLTVLPQSDSYDFTFEGYDYSHVDEADPGMIQMAGSYLLKSNYFQTNIGLSSIYLDSIAEVVLQFMDSQISEKYGKYMDKLEPYVLSSDIYASTDLKSISYNVPYVLMANTQKDNQFLMVSLNGSEQNIQLNQLSLIVGQYALEASAALDINPDTKDMFYSVDLNSASIPYHLSGTILQNHITVSGDYGTDVSVNFGDNKQISGYAYFENVPLGILNKSLLFSLDTQFHYDEENGPDVQVKRFEAELADGTVMVSPKIAFSGNMTKYGAQLDTIAYTDMYSALQGTSDLMINVNEGLFDSVGVVLNLENPLSDEGIYIDGSISNPDHLPLTTENFMKYIYLNLQLQLNSFGLNRFGFEANDNNRLTATLFSSGTLEHPYLSINIEDSAILMSTEFLKIKGSIVLEDRDLSINGFDVKYDFIDVGNIQAEASLDTMTLSATGNLACDIMSKTVVAPLSLEINNSIIPEGKFIPDSFLATLSTTGFSGTFLKKEFPLSFSVLYADKLFNIYSSDNCGLSGIYSTDGILELTLDNKNFIKAKMDGFLNTKEMALQLYDMSVNLAKLFTYINMDEMIEINKGNFDSNITLTGNMRNPDFMGSGSISNAEIKLPMLTNQKLTCDTINLNIVHDEFEIEDFLLGIKNGQKIQTGFKIYLNKWSLNHLEGNVKTLKKDIFPVKMATPLFKLNGDVSVDLQLYFEAPVLEVNGKIIGENILLASSITSVSSATNSVSTTQTKDSSLLLRTDLDITLGTHASINFDPLLRCVFVPNTQLNLRMDQNDDTYIVDGVLSLKSGDLAYLNRNFYIKSGAIKFNPNDITNPIITVNAETREKDDRGQTVRIILNVDNQYLLSLDPKFTSVPAKSENEIRILLGQIAVADSSSAANFIVAASDYALQSIVGRTAENKLRDLLNFDIFSLRTNVLQNTFNRSTSKKYPNEQITIGNLLDNSTVYIGKYLGSSLYLDAMLHVSFEDRYGNDITSVGSLLFQPEMGMELESPFANIRVNMAPDINALLNNQFVPSTSLTLSWKFSY